MGKKITQQEFEQRIRDKLGDDYKALEPYQGRDIKVKMIHYVCGNTFMKRPHDIFGRGSGCPFCNGSRPALYNEDYVKKNTPLPYHYVSGYVSMKTKCAFHCSNCNQDFLQYPSRLLNEHIAGCGCSPTKKKTHEQFLNELGQDTLKEYDILDTYINIDNPIRFKHKNCGTIFKLSPYKFIYRNNKKYCPICYFKKSKGEIIINEFLEKHNIEYQRQFCFPNLPKRFFDFFLPELQICLEYDGEQHQKPIVFFGGDKGFQELQQRDKEKNTFCLENNIKLFRIPYTEKDNLNQILYEIFEEKSSTTIEKFLITK